MSQIVASVRNLVGNWSLTLQRRSDTISVSDDLYHAGEAAGMMGLGMMVFAFSPNAAPDYSLKTQVVVRTAVGAGGAVCFLVGPAFGCAASGVAYLGERLFSIIGKDTMKLFAQDIEELRKKLIKRQEMLGEFEAGTEQIKFIVCEVLPALTSEVAEVPTAVEANLPVIQTIAKRLEQNQKMFDQTAAVLTEVERCFTTPLSPLEQKNLLRLVGLVAEIEKERERTLRLDADIENLSAEIEAERKKLEVNQRQADALNVVRAMQVQGIQQDALAYLIQAQLQEQYRSTDGSNDTSVSVLS